MLNFSQMWHMAIVENTHLMLDVLILFPDVYVFHFGGAMVSVVCLTDIKIVAPDSDKTMNYN